jgi:drug/metabolite transporter (DMT)-like permease
LGWKRGSFLGVLAVAFGAALWGTDGVLRVPLLANMSPPVIVLAEHLVLLLYSVPVVIFGWRAFKGLRAVHWISLLVISWGGSALATLLFTAAFAIGNPTVAILLQKIQPLFAAVLASTLLRERLSPWYWVSFAVAIMGAYLVSFRSFRPFTELMRSDEVLTAALAIGAALLWGSSTVLGRFVLKDMPFHVLTGARLLIALPLLVVIVAAQGSFGSLGLGFSIEPVNIVLLALIPGLMALLLYYRGLTSTQASYAALAELAFPATAVALNWALLDVRLSTNQIIGFLLLWSVVLILGHLDTRAEQPRSTMLPADPGQAR